MACCAIFSKYLLATINLVWFIGLIVVAILLGLFWKSLHLKEFAKLVGYKYLPMLTLTVTGVVMIFAVIIGFTFFCTNNKCIRLTYSNLLVLIFLLQVATVALFFVYKTSTETDLKSRWGNSNYKTAVLAIEHAFKCCGFEETTQDDITRCREIPEFKNKTADYVTCKVSISNDLKNNQGYVIAGIVLLILFQITLIVLAFYFACASDEDLNGEEEDDEFEYYSE